MLKMEKIVYQAEICLFNELLTFESCMYNVDNINAGVICVNDSHGGAAFFVQLSRLLLFSAILNFIFQLFI